MVQLSTLHTKVLLLLSPAADDANLYSLQQWTNWTKWKLTKYKMVNTTKTINIYIFNWFMYYTYPVSQSVRHLFSQAGSRLSTVYLLLSTVYCLPSAVYCLQSNVYCLLLRFTVHYLLSYVYCLLDWRVCWFTFVTPGNWLVAGEWLGLETIGGQSQAWLKMLFCNITIFVLDVEAPK